MIMPNKPIPFRALTIVRERDLRGRDPLLHPMATATRPAPRPSAAKPQPAARPKPAPKPLTPAEQAHAEWSAMSAADRGRWLDEATFAAVRKAELSGRLSTSTRNPTTVTRSK